MLLRIISGGQSGVDTAALRRARACGFETGGTVPKGCFNEMGNIRTFALEFGLKEHPKSSNYVERTRANVADADATLWLGSKKSAGHTATMRAVREEEKPSFSVAMSDVTGVEQVVRWLLNAVPSIETLNVAGHRERTSVGIEAEAEVFLLEVFRLYRKVQNH